MSGSRVIDLKEEDIKSDLEEEHERDGEPAPVDELEEATSSTRTKRSSRSRRKRSRFHA
jgi:hypothetical protein